jgi:hypothetical protein
MAIPALDVLDQERVLGRENNGEQSEGHFRDAKAEEFRLESAESLGTPTEKESDRNAKEDNSVPQRINDLI